MPGRTWPSREDRESKREMIYVPAGCLFVMKRNFKIGKNWNKRELLRQRDQRPSTPYLVNYLGPHVISKLAVMKIMI